MPSHTRHPSWRIEDIDFDAVDTASVRNNEFLFLMLASASFVEILSETYSDNLIEHFHGNAEVTDWLKTSWQQEEVQHGRALKTYVQTVWPEFDWEGAHSIFQTQYSLLCTVEQLEPHQALELLARCVVETGTSTFYRAIQNYVNEPVLHELIGNIKADEAAHYTHFRHYFAAYNAVERHGVGAMFAAIWRRLREIRGQDAYIAFKHISAARHPERPFRESDWHDYNRMVKRHARHYYPYVMAVKMLIKPVPMLKPFKKMLEWPLLGLAMLASLG